MAWWEQVEPKGRVRVPVDRLSFDFENPRFTPEKKPTSSTDAAVIAHLAASADLGELLQSISASGYVDIEPLIVIGRGEELVVLEGNRRLAALKALRNPELATAGKLSVPDISPSYAATLHEVSVYRVIDEADARDLIGFKHINGAQAWDAYAKALYATRWLNIERKKRELTGSGLTIVDIANRMGDKHDTIYRIVTAAYVLEQAEQAGCFRVDDRAKNNFSFSHLYTALTYPEFRDFLGMAPPQRTADPDPKPIPGEKLSDLRQLLLWLYGSRAERLEPVVRTQNPDLARLKRVVGDPRSRRVLLERGNLDEAIESTVTATERFEKNLVDAEQSLKNAQSSLDGYNGSDATLLEIGRSVFDKARLILRAMNSAHEDISANAVSRKDGPGAD